MACKLPRGCIFGSFIISEDSNGLPKANLVYVNEEHANIAREFFKINKEHDKANNNNDSTTLLREYQ